MLGGVVFTDWGRGFLMGLCIFIVFVWIIDQFVSYLDSGAV